MWSLKRLGNWEDITVKGVFSQDAVINWKTFWSQIAIKNRWDLWIHRRHRIVVLSVTPTVTLSCRIYVRQDYERVGFRNVITAEEILQVKYHIVCNLGVTDCVVLTEINIQKTFLWFPKVEVKLSFFSILCGICLIKCELTEFLQIVIISLWLWCLYAD